jgi:hypothetical protein
MKAWTAAISLVVFFGVGGWYMWHGTSATVPDRQQGEPAVEPLVAASNAAKAARPGSVRVMLVGNSIASLIAPAFDRINNVAVLDASLPGCGFPPELSDVSIMLPDGHRVPQPPCDPFWETGAIARFHPAVVLWIVSDISETGGTYRGAHIVPCATPYDSLYTTDLEREVEILGARGAHVVVVTEAYSRYLGITKYDGAVDCQNADRRRAALASGAQLVDLFSYVCPDGECQSKISGVTLRPDGLHYAGDGADLIARWLYAQVRGTSLTKRAGNR